MKRTLFFLPIFLLLAVAAQAQSQRIVSTPQAVLVQLSANIQNAQAERTTLRQGLQGAGVMMGHLAHTNEFVVEPAPGQTAETLKAKLAALYPNAQIRIVSAERVQAMIDAAARGENPPRE